MYAICGNAAEAEDAVQDAFVAALRKQRELRRVASPEAWVRTAALNRLRNTSVSFGDGFRLVPHLTLPN
jgi:RNA polymerase sigma-70 factor (ECF subfamily)